MNFFMEVKEEGNKPEEGQYKGQCLESSWGSADGFWKKVDGWCLRSTCKPHCGLHKKIT